MRGEVLSALALAQANAMHINAIADARQAYKSGSWKNLAETLAQYDRMAVRAHHGAIRYVDQVLATLDDVDWTQRNPRLTTTPHGPQPAAMTNFTHRRPP